MKKKHFKEYMGNRKIAIRCLMAIAFFLFLIFSFHFFKIMVLGQSHGVNLREELDKKLNELKSMLGHSTNEEIRSKLFEIINCYNG